MDNRKLAFIGLEADTTSACLSMLKIMNGRSSVEWMQANPDEADVLMLANDSDNRQWQDSNKPCIVIYHNNESKPAAPYTLSHPFRVMQLISVLDDISRTLGGDGNTDSTPSTAPPSKNRTNGAASTQTDFSESLFQAVTNKEARALYQSESPQGSLFVAPAAGAYFVQEPLFNEVRQKTASLSPLKPANDTDLSAYIRRPIAELAWMTAQLASTLPEWLPKDGSFRLKRWPNVRSAKSDRAYLSMSALMTKQPCRREQLAAHAGCAQQQVDRFLSACAMSNLLVCEAGSAAPARTAMPDAPRRRGSFIQGLRHRLGLSS